MYVRDSRAGVLFTGQCVILWRLAVLIYVQSCMTSQRCKHNDCVHKLCHLHHQDPEQSILAVSVIIQLCYEYVIQVIFMLVNDVTLWKCFMTLLYSDGIS